MAKRKSRRKRGGEWAQMRDTMAGNFSNKKGVSGREEVPEKPCGRCKKFSESAYGSDGRGFCAVLKTGSDLNADPPVFVLEGEAAMMTFFNVDAGKCAYYDEMAFIDTDGTECADPHHRRTQRQMERLAK
ncbi:hypothetical protein DSCA_19180 [Desulfosarcina alkanivorans]|uniref:Uncharacterized protein n=1 Tax=Desulfosarcina alkanivorans TaxID=571177 RepID=A0A5K7YFZ8_9BACT|nr:hypothetical protein [Desulfosarcina alkanivorans]BBO67988.1 hypothetical protein DSCA_19180 [Desulfosarcina alkanivorans]